MDAFKTGIKRGVTNGLGMGFIYFVVFASEALGFWYGAKLVRGGLTDCCNGCMNKYINTSADLGIDCKSNFMQNISDPRTQDFYQNCPCDDLDYTPGVMVLVSSKRV